MRKSSYLLLGLAVLLAVVGVSTGIGRLVASSAETPCRDAAQIARDVIKVDGEIMEISTQALRASGNDDAGEMLEASRRMTAASDRLNELQPKYYDAMRKCEGQ